MNHFSKLIKSKERISGTSNLYHTGQKHRWQPGLAGDIWSGGRGQLCGTEPLTYGIWCYLWEDGIRIDLNYRTVSWCLREFLFVGEKIPTHYSWVQNQQNGFQVTGIMQVKDSDLLETGMQADSLPTELWGKPQETTVGPIIAPDSYLKFTWRGNWGRFRQILSRGNKNWCPEGQRQSLSREQKIWEEKAVQREGPLSRGFSRASTGTCRQESHLKGPEETLPEEQKSCKNVCLQADRALPEFMGHQSECSGTLLLQQTKATSLGLSTALAPPNKSQGQIQKDPAASK